MADLTPEERVEMDRVWRKKVRTIEYRAFELCKNVVDGFQARLEEYRKDVDDKRVPVKWNGYSAQIDALENSIMMTQLLLGMKCLPRDCQSPRTLETALRDVGVKESVIDATTKQCEEYRRKALALRNESLDLGDYATRVTLSVLNEKTRKGEKLTPEEDTALQRIYETLADEH